MARTTAYSITLLLLVFAGLCSCRKHATDTEEYRFDKAGRLQLVITPDGNRIHYAWNSGGLIEEVRYHGGRLQYEYDPARLLASVQDESGSTAYCRDALGRVRDIVWSRKFRRLIHYDYDAWNHIVRIEVYNLDASQKSGELPAAARQLNQRPANVEEKWRQWRAAVLETSAWLRNSGKYTEYRVAYQYDAEGRLVGMDGPAGAVTFTYRNGGHEVERSLPNGITTVRQYDAEGRLAHVIHKGADGATLADYVYRRDATGNLQAVVETGEGAPRTAKLQWSGAQLAGLDLSDGASLRLDRDSSGLITAANEGGRSFHYAYDRFGRLTSSGNTSWAWNANGWLESISEGSNKTKVQYDGRGLPKSASNGRNTATYNFDAFGHMASVKVNKQVRYLLTDPESSGDRPLLEWDGSGQLVGARIYGDGLLTEMDSAGQPSFLLRDGLGAVRLVVDGQGKLRDRRPASWEILPAGQMAKLAAGSGDPQAPPPLAWLRSPWNVHAADDDESDLWNLQDIGSASDFSQYLNERNYFQRAGLLADSVEGWNNEQKVRNHLQDFLDSSAENSITVYLRDIGNDWSDAARESRNRCPKGDCIFLPTFGSIPKSLDIAGTVFEKLARSMPFGGLLMTRKMDMPGLIEQARMSGKTVAAIVCESGCGFELERNVGALVNYAQTHPDHLPKIVVQSTDIGSDLTAKLEGAGYPVGKVSESGIVEELVRPSSEFAGPLRRLPWLGGVAGFPMQVASAGLFTTEMQLSNEPLVGRHGIDDWWNETQADLDKGRPKDDRPAGLTLRHMPPDDLTAALVELSGTKRADAPPPVVSADRLRDTFPRLEERLGGIELAARATPESGVGRITGLVYDAQRGVAVLLGDRKLGIGGIQESDLRWALKLAYTEPYSFPQFSLDPADPHNPRGDWMKAVYIPSFLAGTAMGYTMFQCDWLMKQYSFGVSADYDGHTQRLTSIPGGLQDMFTLSLAGSQAPSAEVWTRLWIVADDFRWSTTPNALLFTTTKMAVRAKRQVVDRSSPTGLRDVETTLDPAAAQFARSLSDHYMDIAAGSPEFARLIELAKAVALARWMRENGVPVDHAWIDSQIQEGGGTVEKVHALSDRREGVTSETRSVHGNTITIHKVTPSVYLFGGVDLSVAPRSDASPNASGLLREVTRRTLENDGKRSEFEVNAGGQVLNAAILPVTAAGQKVAGGPHVVEVNGTRREYSATGRIERMTNQDGASVDFQFRGDTVSTAVEQAGDYAGARYSFDPNGSVARIDLDKGHAEIGHSPSGRIAMVAFTDGGGWRTTATRTSDGTEWSVAAPGYDPVKYRYGQDGYLREVLAGDETIVSMRIDTGGRTLTVKDSWTHEESTWRLGEASNPSMVVESSQVSQTGISRRVRLWKGSESWPAASGDVVEAVEEPLGLEPEAPKDIDARRNEETAAFSTPKTAVLYANAFVRQQDGRIRFQFGKEPVTALQSDMDRFLKGGEAPPELDRMLSPDGRPASLLVMAPPNEGGEAGHERLDALKLAESLNRVYGTTISFYLATDAEKGLQNAASLPRVMGPKDIVALAPNNDFNVKEYKMVEGIQRRLQESGVEVAKGARVFQQGNVLLVVGHKDQGLRNYLTALGDAGSLKDKYVLLFSCHAASDVDLNAHLIRQYGLTGIHFFGDEVNINAVSDALFHLGDSLKEDRPGGRTLPMLLRQAIERAKGKADPARLKQELQKLLRGVTQVSELVQTTGGANG